METRVTSAAINSYINKVGIEKCLTINRASLETMIEAFNNIYFDLVEDLFVNDPNPDNPQPVIDVLLAVKAPYIPHIEFLKLGTRYLRILCRKPINAKFFESSSIRLIKILLSINEDEISIEVCHILLRILGHLQFVKLILQDPELIFQSLLGCLQSSNETLSIAAAAAFQSFAFHQNGKNYVCGKNVHVKALSLMLERPVNSPLFASLLGYLHNVSSEVPVITSIRESGAIHEIIEALSLKPISNLTIDAAGIIQNISREDISRKQLIDEGVVDILLNLVVSDDVQVQVRAVGALLNLLGPTCDDMNSLKQSLARLIALSALGRSI